MKLEELLANRPAARHIPDARSQIRQGLIDSGKRLVIIDDDPTGGQTTHDVSVFMDWSTETLRKAIASGEPVFFISTNSRSLSPEEAKTVSLEVGGNLREAARLEGAEVIIASRSDSTLRGHFPYEVDALADGLEQELDGTIVVPAFFEGGRYTVDDIQWVEQGGEVVPAHQTEFARDPVFGFKHSDLKEWIAEKTEGAIRPGDVRSISLKLLREGGPEAVAETLSGVRKGMPVIANAACYEDLEILALGIISEEEKGRKFAYRCAASFVKARGGFSDRALLTGRDFSLGRGPGLVVVGSYVDRTSRQLKELLDSGLADGIEISVRKLQKEETRAAEIESTAQSVNEKLSSGITAVLYTSRTVDRASNKSFLETGRTVILSLCEVIRKTRLRPDYLVAKGGITSIELARAALDVKEASVLGQIINGTPVWKLGKESRWPDIPYVVFPGNVGDDYALRRVIEIFQAKDP